ncbi:hypothetical protein [Methanococcoides methylutens]|uniref:Uncharacterized protein n=1 Tax=Methanococcoides methylutens MM1 TaxID=1434104 RepID=A0A0E3WZB4_METMT|nr:hypothetical protein [Methanococcoides methylutens]AKB84925.1 hypothetical protein MCMEM_0872 [Methanococcoides methylutens MM1]
MSSKEELDEVEVVAEEKKEDEADEMTEDELDELMMQQSKTPGCKKHRGYGKFDKPAVNRGVAVSSESGKEKAEKEKQN